MKTAIALALSVTPLLLGLAVGCGSEGATPTGAEEARTDASAPTDAGPPLRLPAARACEASTLVSTCKSGGAGGIIRGVARFDPAARVTGTAAPALALFLRHGFALRKVEASIGGRLHGYLRVPLTAAQLASGVVPFAIDFCAFGVSMWSEENGDFQLVGMLDENGQHDMEKRDGEYDFQTAREGEFVGMARGITISCRGASACVDLPLDCTRGTACTTIVPFTSMACAADTCGSDSAFCK